MKRGHMFWAKYRDTSQAIDLHGLFSDYWSSKEGEFTVMSQSPSSTSPRISSDRRTEDTAIGKHRGHLELQFSANDTVRSLETAHLCRLINLRIGRSPTLVAPGTRRTAKGILPADVWINGEIRGQGAQIWRSLRRGQLSYIHQERAID